MAVDSGFDVLIVRPDFERRIDLPGAGLCPRPVDIDRARAGFANLVSLRVYSFAQGTVIDGEAEADEVLIVLMRGRADVTVASDRQPVGAFGLAREDGTRAVYLPPQSAYRLSAVTDCDIAYARAKPRGSNLPASRGFAPVADRLEITGHAVGMDLTLATVRAGHADLAHDGRFPERFVHVRSDNAVKATVADQPLADWDTVALNDGESASLKVQAGIADVLTVRAARCGSQESAHSSNVGHGPP